MAQRRYSREFKMSAVSLVNAQGYTVPEAAKSLGIYLSNIRGWLTKFSSEPGMATSAACFLHDGIHQFGRERNRRAAVQTREEFLFQPVVDRWKFIGLNQTGDVFIHRFAACRLGLRLGGRFQRLRQVELKGSHGCDSTMMKFHL